jgi:hypothetical protein
MNHALRLIYALEPNVVLILADDLGYSDLRLLRRRDRDAESRFAGEERPALHAVLQHGPLLAHARRFAHRLLRPADPSRCAAGPRRRRARRASIHGRGCLPTFLKPAGYRSYHSGKWHIDGKVLDGGFDRSLDMKNQGNFFTAGQLHRRRAGEPPPMKKATTPRSPRPTTRSTACKITRRITPRSRSSITSPSSRRTFPLHALPEDIAKYRDKYLGLGSDARGPFCPPKADGPHEDELSALERERRPAVRLSRCDRKTRPRRGESPAAVERASPTSSAASRRRRWPFTPRWSTAWIRRSAASSRSSKRWALLRTRSSVFASDNGASAEIMVRNGGHDPRRASRQRRHLSLPRPRFLQRLQHAASSPQNLGA